MKKYYLFLFLIVSLISCKKSFFDINNNPNQVLNASYQVVLPAVQNSLATTVSSNKEFANLWMGFWAISGSYAADKSRDSYEFSNTYYQNIWSSFYSIISNLDYIENNAKLANDVFYQGIAKTLKVFCFHNLVDIYGDVPYKQASKIEKFPNPKYDSDSSIYRDLFVQLDSARLLISKFDNDFIPAPRSNSDLIFQGDSTKWFKFINTLELKLLLRLSEVSKPDYYSKELAIINNDSHGFLGTDEPFLSVSVNPGYSDGADENLNPFYFNYGFSSLGTTVSNYAFYVANSYGVNFFTVTNDPRIRYFYTPSTRNPNVYSGNVFGVQGKTSVSKIGASDALLKKSGANVSSDSTVGIINSPSQDALILSGIESLFLQAEATQRGLINGDFKYLYQRALQESFYKTNVDSTNVFTYYNQTVGADGSDITNLVNIDKSTNPLSTILTQKWASLNVLSPLEVYADYRRTKIPSVPGSQYSKIYTVIPNRLYYPNTEIQTNFTNVPSQPNINSLYKKIFWIP